jgi:hypothetical protein
MGVPPDLALERVFSIRHGIEHGFHSEYEYSILSQFCNNSAKIYFLQISGNLIVNIRLGLLNIRLQVIELFGSSLFSSQFGERKLTVRPVAWAVAPKGDALCERQAGVG